MPDRQKKVKISRILNRIFLLAIAIIEIALVTTLHTSSTNSILANAQPTRAEIRGVWMTNNDLNTLRDRRKLSEALIKLKQLNFNTIYPVVWNSGYAMYPSVTAKKAGIQPFLFKGTEGQDLVASVVAQAHNQGLLMIPWFEFGLMAPTTSELAINRQSWLTQKRDRSFNSINEDGEVVWLNPFRPEVQEFITDLVLEVVSNYDVDGIQFDDHMSLPNEFGYDSFTVNLFRKDAIQRIKACEAKRISYKSPKKSPQNINKNSTKNSINNIGVPLIITTPVPTPPPPLGNCNNIPTEPSSNPSDPYWVKWRADKITEFMVRLNKAVKQRKPNAIFSVSPNYYDFAYKEQLQDWLAWIRQDIVDELLVQVYRPDLSSFVSVINRPEIQQAKQKIPTAIAILSGLRSNPSPIRQIQFQVQATRERNLGISFFYFNSLWNYGPEPMEERMAQIKNFFTNTIRVNPLINNPAINNPFIN